MNGLLLVDKPVGWTSHDVVAKVRSLLRQASGKKVKVGHAGTLDPFATGLLILLVGSATKQASEFLKLDKIYQVTCQLGSTSTTGDLEGVIAAVSQQQPGLAKLQQTLKQFVGETEQVPPAFSALKVEGKRAYQLARAGKSVRLEPRRVRIHSLDNIDYSYPKLTFTVKVSSGTYIRTLVEDIGQTLGTGAYCTHLRRMSIGRYSLTQAISLENLSPAMVGESVVAVD